MIIFLKIQYFYYSIFFSVSKRTFKNRSTSMAGQIPESDPGTTSTSTTKAQMTDKERDRSNSGVSPERNESATQSMMNLTKAIGGGVGGLAKEGKFLIEWKK